MNKQQAIMKRAIRAYNEGSPDFQSIMDDASVSLSDEQWQELERLLEEARKTILPETPEQEQKRLEATVANLRRELEEAEKRLYAFYARKHAAKGR